MTTTPILTFLVESREYTIYNEASKNDLGCVLIQGDKVIAYVSRQLKPEEKNYPTRDLKLATVVTLQVWRHYLHRVPCKICTDY